MSIRNIAKTDNHRASKADKIALRGTVFEWIAPEAARVFDAFAGSGEMFKAVWHEASVYCGCDLKWIDDDRLAFVADNRRVLRAIDLQPFNVFDIDAYGCPYTQAIIVAARRRVAKGEIIGFYLTDGSGLNLKMSGMPDALRELTGIAGKIECGNRSHHEFTTTALRALGRRMGAELIDRYEAVRPAGVQMLYTTAIYRGL